MASKRGKSARSALTRKQSQKLRADLKLVRAHFRGFEARNGYRLTGRKIPAAKLRKLQVRARELRREMSQPYKVVRPRTKAATAALYRHTRAQRVKGRKSFLVHVAKPENTTIEIVGRKVKRVREVRRVVGARVEQQHFYFADYGPAPKTMRAIERLARKMLPDMPRGRYVFSSGVYGDIGTSFDRDDLLYELRERWSIYDAAPSPETAMRESRGLAATLVGFRFVATTAEGARRQYAQRLSRRLRYQMAKAKAKGRKR